MYPEDFVSQRTLFKAIKAKDTADGAASVIKPYLTQHGIDLTRDATDGDTADTREAARALLSKQSENFRQLRDLKMDPVMSRLRGEAQFLKGFYKPNVDELGNWGITVSNGGKLVYPADFSARAMVFDNFKVKHDSFPAGTSPLQPYLTQHNISLTRDKTDVDDARTANSSFAQTARDAEDAKHEAGDGHATEGKEPGIEFRHGKARHRQRQAEGEHADQAEEKTQRLAALRGGEIGRAHV